MGFDLNYSEPIAIYGGGQKGLWLARRFIDCGYNVIAIIDRSPEKLVEAPVQPYTLNEFKNTFEDAIIMIAMGNAGLHHGVALQLFEQGYKRILFLPIFLRSKVAKKMIEAWNAVFVGDFSHKATCFDELFAINPADFVICDAGEYISAVIPKSLVYTGKCSPELTPTDKQNHYYHYSYLEELPILLAHKSAYFDVHIESSSVENILEKTISHNKKVIMSSRTATLFDLSFYWNESPAAVNWNEEKKHFNLLDGYHRSRFLVELGLTGIPCRMLKSHWIEYFRQPQAQALMDYVRYWESLPTEVIHPAFAFFPVNEREPDAEFKRLHKELCQ